MAKKQRPNPPTVITNSDLDDLSIAAVRRYVSANSLWRLRPFTTQSLRDESHALLAQELSISVGRGLPLAEALEAYTLPEFRAAGNVLWWVTFVAVLCFSVAWYSAGQLTGLIAAMVFLALVSSLFFLEIRSDDYRRHVAAMLLQRVKAGHSLGQAMRGLPRLFSAFEIETVSAGEQSGRLTDALRELSRQNRLCVSLRRNGNMFIYPILMLFIVTLLWNLLFARAGVYSRFEDILSQLQYSASPGGIASMKLSQAASLFRQAERWGPAIMLVAVSLLALYGLRAFCNGSRVGTFLWICASVAAISALLLANLVARNNRNGIDPDELLNNVTMAAIPIVGLVIGVGAVHLGTTRVARGIAGLPAFLRWLPYIRSSDAALLESHFLAALRVMLLGDMPEHEAWKRAAETLGRRAWNREANRGAEALQRGTPMCEVLGECRLLERKRRASLRSAAVAGSLPDVMELARANAEADADHRASLAAMIYAPILHMATSAVALSYLMLIYKALNLIASGSVEFEGE
jgi:type II secretory pathway component PulF